MQLASDPLIVTNTSVKPPDLEFTSATWLKPERHRHTSASWEWAQSTADVSARQAETKSGCSPNYTQCVTVVLQVSWLLIHSESRANTPPLALAHILPWDELQGSDFNCFNIKRYFFNQQVLFYNTNLSPHRLSFLASHCSFWKCSPSFLHSSVPLLSCDMSLDVLMREGFVPL